jgi:hypothetical protein
VFPKKPKFIEITKNDKNNDDDDDNNDLRIKDFNRID